VNDSSTFHPSLQPLGYADHEDPEVGFFSDGASMASPTFGDNYDGGNDDNFEEMFHTVFTNKGFIDPDDDESAERRGEDWEKFRSRYYQVSPTLQNAIHRYSLKFL
jgi:hypothetical protein